MTAALRKTISEAGSGLGGAQAHGASGAGAITMLVFPAPPSTNNLFKNVRGVGRVATEMYKSWKSEAGWRVRDQQPAPVPGAVVISVGVERANKRADIDNRIKAIFDLLVSQGVIEDDSKIIGFLAAWHPPRDGLARVAIMPATNVQAQFQLATDGSTGGWFLSEPQPDEGGPHGH